MIRMMKSIIQPIGHDQMIPDLRALRVPPV